MKIKKDLKKITAYSSEEKYKLFVERKIKTPTPQKNKKKYTRKRKHKCDF